MYPAPHAASSNPCSQGQLRAVPGGHEITQSRILDRCSSRPDQETSSVRTACCPGTYDPVTNGHLDIVARATKCFDKVIVAVLINPAKQPMFTLEERLAMLKEATVQMPSVEVDAFSGLLVDYARRREVTAIVKGLRAVSDFDYELQMAQMNHRLSGVDTMFMTTNPIWSYLSSSLVKDVARHGGDVTGLVPDFVLARLRERAQQPPP
jgi:pantetheine-phosphate adenylyltransferase